MGNDLQTVLLLYSAFPCIFRFFGLTSSDTVTTLVQSLLASFLPSLSVVPAFFSKFVMEVGAERIRTLGMKQNKVPLISNTLDKKYKSSQKPVGNGWYLMTCSNTLTKKRDIERIANMFNIKIKVEIV